MLSLTHHTSTMTTTTTTTTDCCCRRWPPRTELYPQAAHSKGMRFRSSHHIMKHHVGLSRARDNDQTTTAIIITTTTTSPRACCSPPPLTIVTGVTCFSGEKSERETRCEHETGRRRRSLNDVFVVYPHV